MTKEERQIYNKAYRESNKEEIAEKRRAYYEANKENRLHALQKARAYYIWREK